MMKNYQYESGFTFIEIILAMALLSMVMVGAIAAYVGISRLQQHEINVRTGQQNARIALETMARDIRGSQAVAVSPTNVNGTTMTLSNNQFAASASTVVYTLNGYQQVTRNGVNVSGNDVRVTNLTFSYYDFTPGGISTGHPSVIINMTVQQGDATLVCPANPSDPYCKSYDLSTVVSPRLY